MAGTLVLASVLAGCGADEEEPVAAEEVAVCADLLQRENELIQVANDALAALGRTEDDLTRAAALADGYDRLVEALVAQKPMVMPGEPDLSERLAAGQRAAIAELEGERDRFVAEVRAVTQTDERGRAGELQNALEKAFSELEPPRSAYVAAGMDAAIDADPGCRHVTQRGDPAR
ncbi:hypothetical protein NHL50_14820 [Acidimicrobiia bacterium EGI L10123]|uniref:hypothetical protein n=1 Tax=Salinilacustrithrix flava TaxID=2957203 RepID=UPI003D7C189F|nr:hypothetical protein [Acidimicrobiia bacterium EGI L10123]